MKYVLQNEEDMRTLGLALGKEAQPGDVLALMGDLGAGKTTLTRYIAQGLGITERIQSPTFTIMRMYHSGRLPLYHFDVYRLEGEEDLDELDAEEYFYGEGLCVVEWADLIEGALPENSKIIHLLYGEEEGQRIVQGDLPLSLK